MMRSVPTAPRQIGLGFVFVCLAATLAMLLGMDVLSQMDQVSIDFLSRTVRFVLAPRR